MVKSFCTSRVAETTPECTEASWEENFLAAAEERKNAEI